eukprot:scaffold529669_cov46-Prasinocladus_malaysianus.AAC.1
MSYGYKEGRRWWKKAEAAKRGFAQPHPTPQDSRRLSRLPKLASVVASSCRQVSLEVDRCFGLVPCNSVGSSSHPIADRDNGVTGDADKQLA